MASKLMKALWYDSYGGGASGLKHVEIPVPTPKKDQVLVKVEAASINPVDYKIQTGAVRPFLPKKFPWIPVSDVAGEVVEVGPGVTTFKAGDKILTHTGTGGPGDGLAEYAVADIKKIAIRPPEVPADVAAALPVAACTAYHALTYHGGIKLDGSGPQKNILITAASGGVGHYAVQIAKMGNTHVTATCGARNIELVKSLGADEVLDYRTPEGKALTSPSGKKYDFIFECASGTPWSTFQPNLTERGLVVDITPTATSLANAFIKKITCAKQKLIIFIVDVNAEKLEAVLNFTKEGKLKTIIDSKYPLSKAEDAWAKSIEGHATGKIVVEV